MDWFMLVVLVLALLLVIFWTWFEERVPLPPQVGKNSKGEAACREIFERIFHRPFPRVRPDFLRNPATGRNLELDGYCAELKLAFEYNGKQHYIFPNFFHKTREDFLAQVRRDDLKVALCSSLGVTLVVVPYTVKKSDMEAFVLREIAKKHGP